MNVLIVDDQASQRAILRHLVQDIGADIRVSDFADPVEALLWSQEEPQDMVILDYRMPNMDGLEFARQFRRPLSQRDVPMMLVTVVGDEPVRQAALDAGIMDFMVKPIRPRELRSRCKNLLDLRQRQQALKSRAFALEHRLLAGSHESEQRELALLARIARLAGQREGADPRFSDRISELCGLLARGMGIPDQQAGKIECAAQLHDIGNIGISDSILGHPGPLSHDQRRSMQQHTVLGHEALQGGSAMLALGAEIALGHHERWDGQGYPFGLSGHEIPVSARIVAVADVLDALLSARPSRGKWTMEAALDHIKGQSGLQFDPEVIKVLASRELEIVAAHRAYEST